MSEIETIELPVVQEPVEEWESIEAKIIELFKREIYLPLLKLFGENGKALQNSKDDLLKAIQSGRIQFNRGVFSGKLNATLTKELRLIAKWDRKTGTFKALSSSLPLDVRNAISASDVRFQEKLKKIDDKLSQILPEEIAGKLNISQNFDSALWKTNQSFKKSVRSIIVAPKLTDEESKRISAEWNDNMKLWISDFTKKEITELRGKMQKTILSGNRYGSAVQTIQDSYGVSERKAKFLARQETNLLMAKYKEVRYQSIGVNEYKWHCVSGTKLHPVRKRHRALADASKKGKTFNWNNPPVTSEPGEPERRNNPKQDYNCRCSAIPVVRFRK